MLRNEFGGHCRDADQCSPAPIASPAETSAGSSIGRAAKPVRRQRARTALKTIGKVPAVGPIGSGDASGDEEATPTLQTRRDVPPVANFGAGAGWRLMALDKMPSSPIPSGGQKRDDYLDDLAASEAGAIQPPSHIIHALVSLQKQRVFCIKSQSRCDRSCEAFIASALGYDSPKEKDTERAGEKARKALFARAAAMRNAVEKGSDAPVDGGGHRGVDDQWLNALSICAPIIVNSAQARSAWDKLRAEVERQQRKLARSLPAYDWVKSVAGFGDLGLAIIVGETGDLVRYPTEHARGYATKERVWKRLGLAVIDGERQQKRTNAEQAAAHGYNPRRRAEIWTIADSLFKHQWHGAKEDVPPGPSGPYGEVYGRRREHTRGNNEWSDGRKNNDARRVMTKALVEDLWRVWNGKAPLC